MRVNAPCLVYGVRFARIPIGNPDPQFPMVLCHDLSVRARGVPLLGGQTFLALAVPRRQRFALVRLIVPPLGCTDLGSPLLADHRDFA